jgi:hypothetical protein
MFNISACNHLERDFQYFCANINIRTVISVALQRRGRVPRQDAEELHHQVFENSFMFFM